MDLVPYPMARLAGRIGTPFFFYDAGILRDKLAALTALTEGPQLRCRYAMKVNSARKVLGEVRGGGLWIDAVSGNEVLRAGFPGGVEPPAIMLTTDVFRANAFATLPAPLHACNPATAAFGQTSWVGQ